MISRMRRKPSHQSKRKLSKGKRRPAAKTFVKRVSPKLRSRGTAAYGDGSHAAVKRGRGGLLGRARRAESLRRDTRTGRFITYRSEEAIERTSKRFADALKRLADK